MKDSAHNKVLWSVGSLPKDTPKSVINRETHPNLFHSLDAYPFHAFSIEGRRNICARHRLTDAELEAVLMAYTRPDELTGCEVPTPLRPGKEELVKEGGAKW